MSDTKIDVLGLFDEWIEVTSDSPGASSIAADLREARAAVAELIEAARSAHAILLDAAREVDAATALHCEAISDHLAAALAGCGVVP